jgi:hypothetical protein
MNKNNKLLNPKQFLQYYDNYKKMLKTCESINENKTRKIDVQSKILKLQKIFMNCLEIKIENTDNKKELFNILTELRYYGNIPLNRSKNIITDKRLSKSFNKVSEKLIQKMLENKVIDIGFKSEKLNYNIMKFIFQTKIMKLDNIILKINFIDENKIEVQYFDGKIMEHKEIFDIPFDEELLNKKNKKIKLFKIGG